MVVLCTAVALFSGLVLGLELVDAIATLQERVAAWAVSGLVVFVSGCAAIVIHLILTRFPGPVQLATQVDRARPELKDAVACAAELIESGLVKPTPLQRALLNSVEVKTADIDFVRLWMPSNWHPSILAPLIASSACLLLWSSTTDVASKAVGWLRDPWGAFAVDPGNVEAPQGGDLLIAVECRRPISDEVPSVTLDVGSRYISYPMLPVGENRFEFTEFDLDQSFVYRISTASQSSPWFSVETYPPPLIRAVTIRTDPPEYTGLETTEFVFPEPAPIAAPVGSQVEFELETEHTSRVALVSEGREIAVGNPIVVDLMESFTGHFRLVDREGRRRVSSAFTVTALPDEPPVIQLVDPGKDTHTALEKALPIEVYAADDYGLTQLQLHTDVAGLARPPELLLDKIDGELPREVTRFTSIDPARLAAEAESTIAYYFTATDNRRPEPQTTQSDLFFLEIRAETPDSDGAESPMEGSGEEREDALDLRAVLAELKRLMRETHRARPLAEPERSNRANRVAASLSSVRIKLIQVAEGAPEAFRRVENGAIFELLLQAISALGEAEIQLASAALGPSLSLQGEALTNLLRVEAYLSAFAKPSAGQGQGDSEDAREGRSAKAEPDGDQPSIDDLRKARDDLLELAAEQQSQNEKFEQAERNGASAERQSALYEEQRDRGNRVDEALDPAQPGRNPALRQMADETRRQMQGAALSAAASEFGRASRHGQRARAALTAMAEALDNAIQNRQAEAVNSLASSARELAKAQASLRQDTAGAAEGGFSPGQSEELRERQEALQSQLAALGESARRAADAVSESLPDMARQLRALEDSPARSEAQGAMGRAANALRYRQPGRATGFQDAALEALRQIEAQLGEASGQIPGSELQRLFELMEQLDGAAGQAEAGMSDGERLGKLADSLQQAGESRESRSLEHAAARLREAAASTPAEDGTAKSELALRRLREAAATVLEEFFRERQQNRAPDSPIPAAAPKRYRDMIQEYFRSLAR